MRRQIHIHKKIGISRIFYMTRTISKNYQELYIYNYVEIKWNTSFFGTLVNESQAYIHNILDALTRRYNDSIFI